MSRRPAASRAPITRTTVQQGLVQRTNLILNPSFEIGGFWTRGTFGPWAGTSQVSSPDYSVNGGKSGKLTSNIATAGAYWYQDVPNLTVGEVYSLSASALLVNWTSGNVTLTVGNTDFTNQRSSGPLGTPNAWSRNSFSFTASATTQRIILNRPTGTTDVYWNNVQLEKSYAASVYFDGDSVGCSWTGTPHASISNGVGARFLTLNQRASLTTPPNTDIEFGFNVHGSTTPFSLMASKWGLKWARCDFNWYSMQPTRTTYNWSTADNLVTQANLYGINLQMVLAYSPAWATGADTSEDRYYNRPPTDYTDYANWCAMVVARYAPRGQKHFEIWNEANIGFWKPAPDPAAYTALLQEAYTAMKAVDPTITIYTNGMAAVGGVGDATHMSCEDFLSGVYTAGGKDYFDVVSYHPYGWSAKQINNLRQIMVDNGDADKQMCFNEYGEPTWGVAGQSFVSENRLAYLNSTSIQKARNLPFVKQHIFYMYRDSQNYTLTAANLDREGFFGNLRADGTFKPSLYAIQDAILNYSYL